MCLIELDNGQYDEWRVCTVHVVIVAWCWFMHDAFMLAVLTALYIVNSSREYSLFVNNAPLQDYAITYATWNVFVLAPITALALSSVFWLMGFIGACNSTDPRR